MHKSLLVFQTDFTRKEGAVAAMYGVVKSVDRELEILTATHEIPQYDVWSASYRLYQYMKFWPEGTVFVSVIDPGVGTSRKASVARISGGYYIVTPDNGTLTHIKKFMGIEEIREIDESINRLKGKGTEEVKIFHGRDLFSYCAARLASGIISFKEVGPSYSLSDIMTLSLSEPEASTRRVQGTADIADPNFGNLWTNIPFKMFQNAGFAYGDNLTVTITHGGKTVFRKKVPFQKSFGFSAKGEPVIYNNECMNISLAVSMGSFCDTFSVGYGPEWKVEFTQ